MCEREVIVEGKDGKTERPRDGAAEKQRDIEREKQ